jgi:hypothetical protein
MGRDLLLPAGQLFEPPQIFAVIDLALPPCKSGAHVVQEILVVNQLNLVAERGARVLVVDDEPDVEALPLEVPQHIEVDVSALRIGDSIRLSEIDPPAGVTFLDDPDETVLASVTQPMRVVEPEEEAVEGEEAEGEAPGAEAEAAAESGEDAGGEASDEG